MEQGIAMAAAISSAMRCIVLEQINTPEARKLLEELSKGAAGAKLTEEAKTALDRLAAQGSR